MKNGLVVDDIEFVIQYNPKTCFDWFMDQVCDERRAADIGGPEQKIIGEANKLMGNNVSSKNEVSADSLLCKF